MPKSIGVVFASIETNVQDILAFLTTYQNTLQGTFEFRLLSCPDEDDFVDLLSRPEPPTHAQAAAEIPGFVSRIKAAQVAEASDYGLSNELIDKVVVLTGIRFSDNYYYVGNPKWAIIALGGWHRDFSPPSIVEYYLSILVTSALDALGANIDRHYNTVAASSTSMRRCQTSDFQCFRAISARNAPPGSRHIRARTLLLTL